MTVQRTRLRDSTFGLFSPIMTLLTVDHTRLCEQLHFQSLIHMTGEIFQVLSIQKVSLPAGIKHIGPVCCLALGKSGLLKEGYTFKMETY